MVPLIDAHRAGGDQDYRLIAGKAYTHPGARKELRRRKIKHTIPERSDQKRRHADKGSAGGRPPAFARQMYKHRNTVERGFGRLKQWRGVATRYDKYAVTFLGGVLLCAADLHSHNQDHRPATKSKTEPIRDTHSSSA